MTNDFKTSFDITDGQIFSVEPAWSPDKRNLAFIQQDTLSSALELWTIRYDGKEKRHIKTPDSLQCGLPRWSPDGQKLAFIGFYPGKDFGVYVVDLTDNHLSEISNAGFLKKFSMRSAGYPDWSPDGKTLVFSFHKTNGPAGIGMLNLENQSFASIPGLSALSPYFPRCSPDGDEILFIGANPSIKRICLYRVKRDGSGLSCLTPNGGSEGNWSSDGEKVIYVKPKVEEGQIVSKSIWWVSRDGSRHGQIVSDASQVGLPDW